MIVFSKYSNDRRPELAVRTDIVEEGGVRKVVKTPAGPAAKAHINTIARAEKSLGELFGKSVFSANRGRINGESLELEYLEGRTLEEEFDDLLNDKARAAEAVTSFLKQIEQLADTSFEACDDFRKVFGDACPAEGVPAVSVADIDLIPGNIIDNGKWIVIDYEWTFFFPVPVSFLIWRSLYYYIHTSGKRLWLEDEGLYGLFGIGRDLYELYEKMEAAFQHYVDGERKPLRQLYETMSPGYVRIGANLNLYTTNSRCYSVGMTDDASEVSGTETEGRFDEPSGFRFDVAGRDSLTLVLKTQPAVFTLYDLTVDGRPFTDAKAASDGLVTDDLQVVATAPETLLRIGGIPEGKELRMSVSAQLLDPKMTAVWSQMTASLKRERSRYEDLCRDHATSLGQLEAYHREYENKEQRISDIEDLRLVKAYRAYRKRRGQDDPFDRLKPVIPDTQPTDIYYSIDETVRQNDSLILKGWVYDHMFGRETTTLRDKNGSEVKGTLKRVVRADVNRTLELADDYEAGFEITVPSEALSALPWHLEVEDPRGVLMIPLAVSED